MSVGIPNQIYPRSIKCSLQTKPQISYKQICINFEYAAGFSTLRADLYTVTHNKNTIRSIYERNIIRGVRNIAPR